MFVKIYKSVAVFGLLWLLSLLYILKIYKFGTRMMLDDESSVFNELHGVFENKNMVFQKSNFKFWHMFPEVTGDWKANEIYSILKNPDKSPGIDGKPVILKENINIRIREQVKKGWHDHAFNNFVSDLIPVNRTIPDIRDNWCKKRLYSSELPKATVIICFHNEAWSTLLRTVHSVINQSPRNLLDEIILIDDASTMHNLKYPLDKYMKTLPKVKLIRTARREGLIRARILGTKKAKSPIVVFLDSHCECIKGWLEPLLERIYEDPTKVVSPIVDNIHAKTFEYIHQELSDLQIGGFTWFLEFCWITIPHAVNNKRINGAAPIKSPTISGGLFAIDKKYFENLGYYDSGFEIWGAENLELSFKTWMCGGSLEMIPCSHVGHVFRKRFPYQGIPDSNTRNKIRLAEVWLDDYAKYFYERIGNRKHDGDVTERKALRAKLNCKSFQWYLKNVYPQLLIPDSYVGSGQIVSLNNEDWCLESTNKYETFTKSVTLRPCHRRGKNQYWIYTKSGEIRHENLCVDYIFNVIVLYLCRGKAASQIWLYDEKVPLHTPPIITVATLSHSLMISSLLNKPEFRKGFSTIDHIHTLRQIIQKTEKYNRPLCLAFVDYEKAFDSTETCSF